MTDFRHIVSLRVDASLQMGTGHVMRCLTLADALRLQGATCHFICREHPGNLAAQIRERGYYVHLLPQALSAAGGEKTRSPPHLQWLGARVEEDAEQTAAILAQLRASLLIVDHYALGRQWERALRPYCARLFAIDDLADRAHECDLLLDQNLGRQASDYAALVPDHCTVMAGPSYALLRPEFAQLRDYSLRRRECGFLRHLLVAMGGVDLSNATQCVLETLQRCGLPQDCRINVILGAHAPWLTEVCEQAAKMRWVTHVEVSPKNMAQRMAENDLAIGAAGGSAWERCCLGLPTLVVVLAENQRPGAKALAAIGAAQMLGDTAAIHESLPQAVASLRNGERLAEMSRAASAIVDGQGVERVTRALGAAFE